MASAKSRPGKISPKHPIFVICGQKSAQKTNDWASFHELLGAEIRIFK